jgi:hypothetical protein
VLKALLAGFSSQTKGLPVNPDSSVDIYFGPKSLPGKENN